MRVHGTGNYQPTSYVKTDKRHSEKHVDGSSSAQAKGGVELRPDNPRETWGEIARKYDIRNASFSELCDIASELYGSAEISLFEVAVLTFDPSQSPQPIRPNMNLTQANHEGRRDWIVEYQERARRDMKIGNTLGYAQNEKVVQLLGRLAYK